jgi:hypothetical protein|tara:strand:- start:377 stop:808 length:432 start_codon:yes stop_codon:yes gene_type:complete
MEKYCLIVFIFVLLISCGKPSVIDNTFHTRIIQNDSEHLIKIKKLKSSAVVLSPNETYIETQSCEQGHTLPLTSGYLIPKIDSLIIIYDDTFAITHGSSQYTVLRDLRKKDMFPYKTKRVDKTIEYTYTYTFTNSDFDEAKTK